MLRVENPRSFFSQGGRRSQVDEVDEVDEVDKEEGVEVQEEEDEAASRV